MGRPSVDSDQLNLRVGREAINAIDAFAASQSDQPRRTEAARRILTSYLREAGFLTSGDEGLRPDQLNTENDG